MYTVLSWKATMLFSRKLVICKCVRQKAPLKIIYPVKSLKGRDAENCFVLESLVESAENLFQKHERYNIHNGLLMLFLYVYLALLTTLAGLQIDVIYF